MPPLAALATAAGAAAVTLGSAAVAALPTIAAGTGIYGAYTTYRSTKEAEKARSAATEMRQREMEFAEKQAGEYYQLSQQQMELQAQASSISTLANLIAVKRQPAQQVAFTAPPAKVYSAADRINLAIGDFFKVA